MAYHSSSMQFSHGMLVFGRCLFGKVQSELEILKKLDHPHAWLSMAMKSHGGADVMMVEAVVFVDCTANIMWIIVRCNDHWSPYPVYDITWESPMHLHEDFDATLHSQKFKLACHWQKKPTASFQENSMFQLALHCAIGLWIISAPWTCNKCSTIFHLFFKQSSDDSAHKNSSRIHNIHIHSSHTSSWLFIPQQLDGHFGEDKVLRCFEWFEQEDSFLLVVEATWTPFTTKRIEGNQSDCGRIAISLLMFEYF